MNTQKITIKSILSQGIINHENGDFAEAKKKYLQVLSLDKRNSQALHYIGIIEAQNGNFTLAIESFTKAIQLNPIDPFILCNRANALNTIGKYQEALNDIDKANLLKISKITPLNIKGNILHNLGKYTESENIFKEIITIEVNNSDAITNLANSQKEQGKLEEAFSNYKKSLLINPNSPETHLNFAIALMTEGSLELASNHIRKSISLNPKYWDAYYQMGLNYEKKCDIKNAIENMQIASHNGHALAQWGLPFIRASIYNNERFINDQKILEQFVDELTTVSENLKNYDTLTKINIVGSKQPFDFSYRTTANKNVLSVYGKMCNELMHDFQNSLKPKFIKRSINKKIRIGIVGEHIRNHSVWNILTKGIIENINNESFEIYIFHLGNIFDEETKIAAELATSYVNDCGNIQTWCDKIIASNIDVVIYPEIGMHKLTAQLACLRLAKLQLAFWGHPETTGFPTIDYFISSKLIEPAGNANNYYESVHLLPDLGCYFSPPKVTASYFTKTMLGINEEVSILLCPGVSFKYNEDFDDIVLRIVTAKDDIRFIFFNSNIYKSEFLKDRLNRKFINHGLEFSDYITFLPWPNLSDLYGLMSISSLCLDTIVHSGFNTAISCVECSLPQITLEGNFFRNRQASAILRNIEITETITNSIQEYVDITIKLLNNGSLLNSIKEKIALNKHFLYKNNKPIRSLENFIFKKLKNE
jgi:protein O-GlcNAc transferase